MPKDDSRLKVGCSEHIEFGGYVYEPTEQQLTFLHCGTVTSHGMEESSGKLSRGSFDV